MNNDSSGKRAESGSFMSSLSDMYHSARTRATTMQQNFAQSHPEATRQLSAMHESASQTLQQAQTFASDTYDSGMRSLTHSMADISREKFKVPTSKDDSWATYFHKRAYNFGVDVFADRIDTIASATSGYATGLGDKIKPGTLDRLDPRHLLTLGMHPTEVQRYFAQRGQQLMQPLDFYNDPGGFMRKKGTQMKNTFWNMAEVSGGLDGGGWSETLKHGGRTVIDYSQEQLAPMLGVGLGMFALYNTGSRAQNTRGMMDHMFPRDTMYGKTARFLPTRLMFTKPFARLAGNPRLTAAVMAYGVATSIGKSIADKFTLEKEHPETASRLAHDGTDSYRSSFYVDMHRSVEQSSRKRSNSSGSL